MNIKTENKVSSIKSVFSATFLSESLSLVVYTAFDLLYKLKIPFTAQGLHSKKFMFTYSKLISPPKYKIHWNCVALVSPGTL